MKKILLYLCVAILVVAVCFLFVRVFSFEEENTLGEVKVSKEVIDQLYSYLPEDDELNRSSMYSHYYMTFNNISLEAALTAIYEYFYTYESLNLLSLTQEELAAQITNTDVKALYKINEDDFDRVYKKIYGNEVNIKHRNFYIDAKTRAMYVNNIGFYIYELTSEVVNVNNYDVKKVFSRYEVTDDGNTIKIYDKYTKCDKTTNICYDDDRVNFSNSVLYNNGAFTNFENAQEYVHEFTLEDGNYYWHSTELSK